MIPFTTEPIEYIALWDAAVDDNAMSVEDVEAYAETFDRSRLRFIPGKTPVRYALSALLPYDLDFVRNTAPRDDNGTIVLGSFYYHLAQAGLRGAADLPEDMPRFSMRKVGMLELVDEYFMRCMPPELATELGSVVYRLSTVPDLLKKKSNSPSGEAKSKSALPAKRARRG